MGMVFVRSGFPFNYDADAASVESGLSCRDKSMAQQSQKAESDINEIVKRFGATGLLPVRQMTPIVGVVEPLEFRQVLEIMRDANASFMTLPAEVRKRFGNDPVEFVEFVADEKNVDEVVRLGLATAKPVAVESAPQPVVAV